MARIIGLNARLILLVVVVAEVIFGNWVFGPKYGFLNIPRNTTRTFDTSEFYPGGGIITYSRDQHGLRGPYANIGKIDLLVMGGSTTNELYIDNGKTWPARMRQRFTEAGTPKTIVNAGLDGQSTIGNLKNFEVWIPNIPGIRARFVLMYVGLNDTIIDDQTVSPFDEMKSPEFSRRIRHFILNNSVFYDLFRKTRGWLRAKRHSFVHGKFAKHDAQWHRTELTIKPAALKAQLQPKLDRYRMRLALLAEAISKFGASPIFVTQTRGDAQHDAGGYLSLRFKPNDKGGYAHNLAILEAYNAVTLEVCRELRLICPDLATEQTFKKEDFYDHFHTTPTGSRKIGDYLFEKLRNVL